MKKSIITLFFTVAIMITLTICAGVRAEGTSPVVIKGGKEILVAQNVNSYSLSWCGTEKNVLVYSEREGSIVLHEPETGMSRSVGGLWSSPMGCTHDGEWLVYMDKDNVRWEDGGTEGVVVDLWRYEIKTGRDEKFIVGVDGSVSTIRGAIFVLGKTSLYLGIRPEEKINMPEPRWKILWSRGSGNGRAWLRNGPAVIGNYTVQSQSMGALEVETFSEGGKGGKTFNIRPRSPSFNILTVGDEDHLYVKYYATKETVGEVIERCSIDIKKERASCETILRARGRIAGFDTFSGNDVVAYNEYGDTCIRAKNTGDEDSWCITRGELFIGDNYRISPDEKWLAFEVNRRIHENVYATDLYITELTKQASEGGAGVVHPDK